MRALIAPAAFKGTLGPREAADAMAAGVRAAIPGAETVQLPLSDGGNGLIEAYAGLFGGSLEEHTVSGPLGDPVPARLLWVDETAVIESADACGLHLLPASRRDPLATTTRGVGELLAAAAPRAREVILGLGGSATVEGGTGMARALGWRFLAADGTPLPEGGGSLTGLARIEAPPAPLALRVVALCDVRNLLLGVAGGVRIYAPQKGAGPADVERLEAGLRRLAEVIEGTLGIDVVSQPGAGAAGGLGAGARAFLSAELVEGSEWMLEASRFSDSLAKADLVLTGEGRYDAQSEMGKLTGRIIELARRAAVPALLVCGSIEGEPGEGVWGRDAGGRRLDAASLAELVASACRDLTAEGTL